MAFRQVGSGDKIVTALHPLALNGSWYEPIIAAMGTEYTWLLPDFPGHGASAYDSLPVTLDGLGDEVIALWDQLGIESSAVVGISLGGMVAQAVTDRARERVWAQVLMGTTHAYPEAGLEPARERIAVTREAPDMSVLAEPTVARWFTPEQIAESGPLVQQARADLLAGTVDVHADYLSAMLALNYANRSPAWAPPPPTLAVGGKGDLSTPVPVIEAMAAAIQDAECVLIDGGHLAAFEHPAAAAQLLDDFFARTHRSY